MNLYVMRHGAAAARGSSSVRTDRQRPLTTKGARRIRQVAREMKAMGLSFDLVLSSPYPRARQTAEIVAKKLRARPSLRLTDRLAVGSSPQRLLEDLRDLRPMPHSMLLVGHEPFLSNLISLLLSGRTGLHLELKKGGLCHLTVELHRPHPRATLHWLLTPGQVIRICK
jgi:phosphohistidine phosphatase